MLIRNRITARTAVREWTVIEVEQLSLLGVFNEEDVKDLEKQCVRFKEYAKEKRNWENAFQKWSDELSADGINSKGICGYGSMCDWCEDNGFGRPCVRALNKMCREKRLHIDYSNRDFETLWYNGVHKEGDLE